MKYCDLFIAQCRYLMHWAENGFSQHSIQLIKIQPENNCIVSSQIKYILPSYFIQLLANLVFGTFQLIKHHFLFDLYYVDKYQKIKQNVCVCPGGAGR